MQNGRTPAHRGVTRAKQRKTSLKLACWNVRTMMDPPRSNRPERRSALVALELQRLGIDIAALSEIRFAGTGSLQEPSVGYTLFWSGKPEAERRLSGVGFMIKDSIVAKLENLPTGHSDRIMQMRLNLKNNQHATLFSVYSPTLQADISVKEKFYTDLRTYVSKAPAEDKIFILGDFNARVGKDAEAWKGVLGSHGVGKRNENGLMLLEFCAELQMTITNTVFQQKNSLKTTWMHPRSKHWHMIDYILVRQRDIRDVLQTRVMPSAECHTDHRLVRCKLNLQFKPQFRRGGVRRKKFQVDTLQSDSVQAKYQESLHLKLSKMSNPADPSLFWDELKSVVLETSNETIGFSKQKKNKDWFDANDQEIRDLVAKKRKAHQAVLTLPNCSLKKEAFRATCSHLQRKLRELKDTWWTNLAKEIQQYADAGNYRRFYEALRAVYGPSSKAENPLRSADGTTLLTDRCSILERWSEHFQTLFSANRTVSDTTLNSIPERNVVMELDDKPTIDETIKAIKQLKNGKAAGIDGIPPELWKFGGTALHSKLHQLFVLCWESGKVPNDFRDAVIITLYKNKGEKSDCSNYRGITLLAIAGKALARMLLNRFVPVIAEDILPETQCGFRSNRGTTDMVFVLRQLQEKCREQNKGLYITFVDLTKAFDTVNREALWKILKRLGCPPKFTNMVVQLHQDQKGVVRQGNDLSKPFQIRNGVKQGCVLAPTLFSIVFSLMLKHATSGLEDDDAVYIRYRLDGCLFNLRRLKSHTKTSELLVRELLFADDAALIAHSEAALQRLTTCFEASAQLFGLEVSLKKTEVLYQPAPRDEYHPPSIMINNEPLKPVQQFKYLGSVISFDAQIDKDIDNRLSNASRAFGRLQNKVWKSKQLKLATKVSLYRAVVLTTLMYGSECWVTHKHHVKQLERFHQRCLRNILHIKWWDFVTDVEVLERAKLTSIEAMLTKNRLRWVGHVSRMESHRLPKIALYGELSSGSRNVGTPKKRYKDLLKSSFGRFGICQTNWTELATDRATWRATINKAATSFEQDRRTEAVEKRKKRKEKTKNVASNTSNSQLPVYNCDHCGRSCGSRIGLYSHQRACKKT